MHHGDEKMRSAEARGMPEKRRGGSEVIVTTFRIFKKLEEQQDTSEGFKKT